MSTECNISDKPPISTRSKHLTEEGILEILPSYEWILFFKREPIWLLILTKKNILYVYLPGFSSFSHLAKHLQDNNLDLDYYSSIVNSIGCTKFKFSSPSSEKCIYLVNGSLPFIHDTMLHRRQQKGFYVTDQHKRYRKIPTNKIGLKRLSHAKIGGATDYKLLFSTTPYPIEYSFTKL